MAKGEIIAVKEVVSSTELVLNMRFKEDIQEPTSWKEVPHVDQHTGTSGEQIRHISGLCLMEGLDLEAMSRPLDLNFAPHEYRGSKNCGHSAKKACAFCSALIARFLLQNLRA